MKISVLMPIYNGIEFFQESYLTVCKQTHTDWELLIGINGHPDPSPILQTIQNVTGGDLRVRVFVQTTMGKPDSLNDLMTHVSTDWVALLDVDDTWARTKLEEQVGILPSLHPDTAVVGTFCHYFEELSGAPNIPAGYIAPSTLAMLNPIINSSCLIRRENSQWTGTYNGVEDYELWMKIALSGKKLYNIGKDLVGHRIHHRSAFNWAKQDVEQLRRHYITRQ